jgi:hypothetical protein
MKTKANVEDFVSVTESQLQTAVSHKIQCSNAARSGNPLPEAPHNLSLPAKKMLNTVEAARAKLPGTYEESLQARKTFYGYRKYFGSQQIFFTLSPDDLKMRAVLRYAGLSEEQIAEMTSSVRQTTAANNPVAAARHFQDMIDIVIKHVFCFDTTTGTSFLDQQGIFGTVLAFGIKIEEQHRGALHAHMLLHIAGLPSTAEEMLQAWKSPTNLAALQKYMEMVQSQSTFLPLSQLRCPACEETDLCQPSFPDDIVQMKAAKASMPEPKLLVCPACNFHCEPSALVTNWIRNTLQCSEEEARSGFTEEDLLLEMISHGSPATMVDGAGTEEGLPYTRRTCAKLASRVLAYNLHDAGHRKSCFKAGDTCRYNFPMQANDETAFHPQLVDNAKQLDLDTLIEDVKAFVIEPKRGVSSPYVNRLSLAVLAAIPSNNDVKICLSSIGVCLYLLGYVSKAENDSTSKAALGALNGFCRALKVELRTSSNDDIPALTVAARRTIMAVMDSTAHNEMRAVMAAYRIMHKNIVIFSHDTAPIYLPQDIALMNGEPVTASLTWESGSTTYVPSVLAMDYVHRGFNLADISRYEFAMFYKLAKRTATTLASSVSYQATYQFDYCTCDRYSFKIL